MPCCLAGLKGAYTASSGRTVWLPCCGGSCRQVPSRSAACPCPSPPRCNVCTPPRTHTRTATTLTHAHNPPQMEMLGRKSVFLRHPDDFSAALRDTKRFKKVRGRGAQSFAFCTLDGGRGRPLPFDALTPAAAEYHWRSTNLHCWGATWMVYHSQPCWRITHLKMPTPAARPSHAPHCLAPRARPRWQS